MADQLLIFLQSRFDAAGVQSAEKGLDSLNKQIAKLKQTGDLFKADPTQFLGQSQENLQALNQTITGYREMSGVLNEAARGALRLQDATSAKSLVERNKLVVKEEKDLLALMTAEDRLKLALEGGSVSRERSIQLIGTRVTRLQEEAKMLREAAAAEASRGKTDQAQTLLNQASAQDKAAESLKRLTDQKFIDTGVTQSQTDKIKTQSTLMSALSSGFNQLGFTMFVTASTARMFFQIFETGFDTLSEGAAVLDRQRAFTQLLSGEGIDVTGLTEKLREASQGTVPLDLAIRKSLQLAKAGFPEIAAQSDQLLAIAVNSAKVTGELDQVETIYEKLIKGIIRGSPRLIDDADIILKLGDSNEKYAESLGKTVEELTAAEKVQATFNAVMQEGERINEMADAVDSTAVGYAQLSTAVKESTDTIKAFAALDIANTLERMGIGAKNFGEGILIPLAALKAIGEEIDKLRGFNIFSTSAVVAGQEASQRLIGVINGLRDGSMDFNQALKELALGGMADIAERTFEIRNEFLGIEEPIEAADQALMSLVDTWQRGVSVDFSGITEGIAEVRMQLLGTGLAFIDVQEKMVEAEQNFGAKMVELRSDMSQKMRDITDNLGEKLQDLQSDYADKLIDIERDVADKREDINSDLADKLRDISSDIQEKRESEYYKHTTKLEDIESDHQKKIAEIMQQFEMSRMKALIDRDALALFEAERRRDEDLQDAQESAGEKRQTEIDEYRRTTQEMADEEQKRRQQAIEEADKRRADAIRDAERQRRDALENLEKQRKDAADDAEKKRAAAIVQYGKDQKAAVDDYKQQRTDLANWNTDRLNDQTQAALNRRLQQLIDQEEEYGRTKEWFGDLTELYNDFNGFVSQNTPQLPPSGTVPGTTPTPGTPVNPTPPAPSDGTDNIVAGAFCSVQSGTAYRGADGNQYLCVGHQWVLASDIFPTGTNSVSGGMSGVSGGSVAGGGVMGSATTSRMPVTIQVNGDKILEEIFKSISYEAFVEIMS